MTTLTRYAYVDTMSTAGRPVAVTFHAVDVVRLAVWHNIYGNPTTAIRLSDGRRLLCVDDYGARNGLAHAPIRYVDRRKDLAYV